MGLGRFRCFYDFADFCQLFGPEYGRLILSTSRMSSIDLVIFAGSGAGFSRKQFVPIAFPVWPIRPVESVMRHTAPLHCSPAQVYMRGMKDPILRRLLYDDGLMHGGIEPGRRGRMMAPLLKASTLDIWSIPGLFSRGSMPITALSPVIEVSVSGGFVIYDGFVNSFFPVRAFFF